ncbi:MAG: hypothetical protein Q8807_03555 ['Waltheria sp.' little leaf phytoplasma]|nr:hypothetical protein ['Waltheria sp.' little leaf phytoplasma]
MELERNNLVHMAQIIGPKKKTPSMKNESTPRHKKGTRPSIKAKILKNTMNFEEKSK